MRRGRHEFRLTVWTFVAPIALVIAVLVVINITQEVLSNRSGVQATIQETVQGGPSTSDAAGPGTTTAGEGATGRRFYRIKAGDTLSQIAARFNITEERLQELNPDVDALTLKPGQRIRVG